MAISVVEQAIARWQQSEFFRRGYRGFAYFGVMTANAALIYGFRYDPQASAFNYLVNVLLYSAFLAPHLMLTRPDVKESIWGKLRGTPAERQIYITLTIVSWLLVLWLQRPVPGGSLELPTSVRFAGVVGFLWALLLSYEGVTREMLDGLLGVPGAAVRYGHADVPLQTDGQYAQVRHPMYRAMVFMGLAALVVHPNAGQLLWTLLLGGTFISYIPVEEAELLEARGDEYCRYCEQTPYRLFRGIW
jgi:protein-S-isoprenylcysteine O-methyltransferase Ste14